mgnify:CR=1 FL=1
MPNLHDIERRIKSVESTKQITHTMQMVAAAKIRHSTERVEAATPYGEAVKEMLANIARMGGTTAPLATAHDEVKKTLIVVIASDRGLAGGFNSSVLRRAEQIMKERKAEGKEIAVAACGKKAIGYFKYRGIDTVLAFRDLSADPRVEEADALADYAMEHYLSGEIDEVVVLYNHAKNAGEQVLIQQPLLPRARYLSRAAASPSRLPITPIFRVLSITSPARKMSWITSFPSILQVISTICSLTQQQLSRLLVAMQ